MDIRGCRCLFGSLSQPGPPNWNPLLDVLGEHLTGTFMWMFEVELEGGLKLQAYKHIFTRSYLYLSQSGQAFTWTPCGGYAPRRLDFAIEEAVCNWWILDGWNEEDRQAVIDAVTRSQERTTDER